MKTTSHVLLFIIQLSAHHPLHVHEKAMSQHMQSLYITCFLFVLVYQINVNINFITFPISFRSDHCVLISTTLSVMKIDDCIAKSYIRFRYLYKCAVCVYKCAVFCVFQCVFVRYFVSYIRTKL